MIRNTVFISIEKNRKTTFLGLLLVAIGSGSIKQCVTAFVGDQFELPAQLAQMAMFLSIVYFAVNSGTILTTFLTPILREDVQCNDSNDCYSLAFGVSGILMFVSISKSMGFFVSLNPLFGMKLN